MGRPRQHKETARLSVSFNRADYERLITIAEANDVSTAWIIRRAVSTYLDDFDQTFSQIGIHHGERKGNPLPAGKRQRQ